jgi:hypothetical protein
MLCGFIFDLGLPAAQWCDGRFTFRYYWGGWLIAALGAFVSLRDTLGWNVIFKKRAGGRFNNWRDFYIKDHEIFLATDIKRLQVASGFRGFLSHQAHPLNFC